jgi:hypothetical protein
MQFLSECKFSSVATFCLENHWTAKAIPAAADGLNISLQQHPELISLKFDGREKCLSGILPLAAVHSLDLVNTTMAPSLVHALSPSVRKLKASVDSDPESEDTGRALDLLEQNSAIKEVQFWLAAPMTAADSFSWTQLPEWYVWKEADDMSGIERGD